MSNICVKGCVAFLPMGKTSSQNVHTHIYTQTHQPSNSDGERCLHYNEIMSANSLKDYI